MSERGLVVRFRGMVVAVAAVGLLLASAGTTDSRAARSSARVSCQGTISWRVANSVVGRLATIRGRVAGTRFASSSNGSPTFLNIGVDYPDPRRFTVVIWIENRASFGRPEVRYRGHTICVRGVVESYRGVPEIEARSPSQIRVLP